MTDLRKSSSTSLTADIITFVQYHLYSRRGLLILAALVAITGFALNWSWLVAIGVAPILIAVLPCLVICGLGLCMSKMTGNSSDPKQHENPALRPDLKNISNPQNSQQSENLQNEDITDRADMS
jgi:hypothetical protein